MTTCTTAKPQNRLPDLTRFQLLTVSSDLCIVTCPHTTYFTVGVVDLLMSAQQSPTGSTTVPEDVIGELLDSHRRCFLIDHLAREDSGVVVEDLVAAISAAEEGCDPSAVDDRTRTEIRAELFQQDIPKLAATGVVEYDSMLDKLRLQSSEVASHATSALTEESDA